MGNCFSNPPPLDDLIGIFTFLTKDIQNLRENLKALTREMDILKATQHGLQNQVAIEMATCLRQERKVVTVWLKHFQEVELEFNEVLNSSPIELQRLCLCDLWSKNVCASYAYGKKVVLLLENVKKLQSKGNFVVATEPTPRSVVQERPTGPTIGDEIIFEQAWNRLKKDETGIMGLHGMGGVGKTTLFKKIHNQFATLADQFDVVIWVEVSQGATILKLQDDIAEQLQLCDEVWTNRIESNKAVEIHRVLKQKRFVLMLDDIWEKVDLEAIGVPFPTKENGCKVAFTTRSREVCGRMGDNKPMQVNCLKQVEAWKLFKSKIGDNILRNKVILNLAERVAGTCRGLPLALNVIGETMASKTTEQEWEHAVYVLSSSAAKFFDMENKILPILKYSYDCLDEEIKWCFLYCALFPGSFYIYEELLIQLWMCEGFMGEFQVIKRGMNKGYEILGALVRANLLIKIGKSVLMHDVVREMALWIASDCGKQKENFVVQVRGGLCDIPRVENGDAVRRMSLHGNEIEEITCSSKFSELTTLFLTRNKLKNISGQFFESMKKLVVLDLSFNTDISKLPEQISELVSLQFLDLAFTSIEQLPVSLQKLKKLTYLNVSGTKKLCSLGGISELLSIRILHILYSKVHADVSLVKELQLLEHLQILSITVSTELGLEQMICNPRFANCIKNLHVFGFQQKPFNISLLDSMKNIRFLRVSYISEIIMGMKSSRESTDPCFSKLNHIAIQECNSTKDLTWILLARRLLRLTIECSEELEEIINKEKAINITGNAVPFEKLEVLRLRNLPKLESIHRSPLPFPDLKRLDAINCPKLRKLPFNTLSVPRAEFRMTIHPQGFRDFEWEDEDTKQRFVSCR